jgi:protein gp37
MVQTKIEWADAVWNPVTGCTPISEGCKNCYAKRMATRLKGRYGYPEDEPFKVTLHPEKLKEPLKWKKPRRVFVCSMGDLFHEDVPFQFIATVFGVMANSSQNIYMVLTKRPQRMKEFFDWLFSNAAKYYARGYRTVPYDDDRINVLIMNIASEYGINLDFMRKWPLFNVWLGVTAENQQRADERIPILLQILAAVRFVSIEPMLGPVDLTRIVYDRQTVIDAIRGLHGWPLPHTDGPKLDWVICGGETGPGARPMHPDWVRSLRDRCQAAGTPFFFKSWGEWAEYKERYGGGLFIKLDGSLGCQGDYWEDNAVAVRKVGKKKAGRVLDGRTWDEFPE